MIRIPIQTAARFALKFTSKLIAYEYYLASKMIYLENICLMIHHLNVYCSHEFHKNCIDPWLIEQRTCPMCKLDVLQFYGYVVGDLTIEYIDTPNNVQFVHLEIPTDNSQYADRNVDTSRLTNFSNSGNNNSGHRRDRNGSSDNCNAQSIANIIIDSNDNCNRNLTASHQITEV